VVAAVAVIPAVLALVVVPDKTVAAVVVAVTPAVMGFAVMQGKTAVTVRALIGTGLKRLYLQ
jgi:uncharacterized membrane protein